MDARNEERGESRAELLLIVMAAGIVGVSALVGALALVDEWWFLAATMIALLACAGGVVAMILRLLAQTGDPVRENQIAQPAVAAQPADVARPRSRRPATKPALGGA